MSDISGQIENRTRNQRRSVTRDNSFPIQQGGGYFQILVPAIQPQSSLLPQYLPPDYRTRDRILDSTPRADAMWSAAIGIAITKAAAMAWDVKSEVALRSARAQELLLNADATSISGIGGWVSYMGKQLRNFTCSNAGCFTEIIRATGAYGSRIVGIGHLSSLRMRRTGDPEYPYIYIDRWGHQHVMRWWQLFNLVDMPDPDEAALGMGLCAAERAYQQIRKLAALEMYLYEKISGSRPLALHIVNGLTQMQLQDMIAGASNQQAQKGMSLYMGAIVATTLKPDAAPGLVTIPLAELPDGFEAQQERERADLIYANSLGLDPQDLRPISNQQMGAGAQSQVLNQKAEGRGQAAYRQQLTHMLNQLVLDDKTKFIFTEHDYQDQKAAADVSNARAGFVTTLVQNQIISPAQGQQILAEQSEIPKVIVEQGAQGGSELSDTDKPDVDDSLNDQSTPPQPQNVPIMQTQAPVQPQKGGSAPPAPTPVTSPAAKPMGTAQPFGQKTVATTKAGTMLGRRSVHASARRLMHQVQRAGRITTKGWVTIHGHPVLIGAADSGGGGSGGGAVSGGSGGKSKSNTAVHGSGGKSKYPTLDAYKKGQITHENAMQMLQQDIKAAKLAGDTKAVSTLNTQYYNLKKAGPAPNVPKAAHLSAQEATVAAHKVTEDFVNDKIQSTSEMDAKLAEIGAKSGHSVDQLKAMAKQHEESLQVAKTPAKTKDELIGSLAGTPEYNHAIQVQQKLAAGTATQSDVSQFKTNLSMAMAVDHDKMDTAQAAIDAAKKSGVEPLPHILKMQQDAKAQLDAHVALSQHIDEQYKKHGVVATSPFTAVPSTTAGPTIASVAKDYGLQEHHLSKAQQLIEKHKAGSIADATYNTQMYKITKEAGVSKAQLEKAAGELGSAPKGTAPKQPVSKKPGFTDEHIQKGQELQAQFAAGKITKEQFQAEQLKIAKDAGFNSQIDLKLALEKANQIGATPLKKTINPIPHMSAEAAAKVGAMPPAKQDLIKLGAVYDQHGGTSKEYEAAIVAYNAKHGTNLNFQSAGPAVKSAKTEAGIPIVAQKKPASSSVYTPPATKPAVSLGHIPEIHHNDPLPGETMSSHELNQWGLQSSKAWSDSLSNGERASLKAYTGSTYASINGGLRTGKSLSPSTQAHVNHIDTALAKASLPRPVTVMRGFSSSTLEQKMNDGLSLDGVVFHDDGYISSSLSHGSSFGGQIKMKINIPKGAHASYLGHISNFGTAESELLIARNANFKIKGYKKVGGQWGHWEIEVDYVGSGPMPAGAFKALGV